MTSLTNHLNRAARAPSAGAATCAPATPTFTPLTGGRTLARNSLWNLFGYLAPLVVAVAATPGLISGLGKERFGVLALTWAVVGYASLFDLGMGRALTQLVAMKLGDREAQGSDKDPGESVERVDEDPAERKAGTVAGGEIAALIWTSMLVMLGCGAAGAILLLLSAPWLVGRALHVPNGLLVETTRSFYLLALSLPLVVTTAALRGVLEAYQRFDLINALRIPMGILTFAGPLLILPFSKSLLAAVAVLVSGRALAWLAHLALCLQIVPGLSGRVRWQRSLVPQLLRFGGWMTVSNVISPLMVTLDRFLIGALLSVTAVAYYVTPFEVVSRLSIIPGAIVGVMFPAYAASILQNPERAARLFERSVKSVFLLLFPVLLILLVLAPEGLQFWLGGEFGERSSGVLRWLAAGVFLNGLASFPFALIQGAGRADLTAKLHLAEAPVYILALWWLIATRGIEGAAIAWTLRATVDALILFALAGRFLPARRAGAHLPLGCAAILVPSVMIAVRLHGLGVKTVFLAAAGLVFLLAGWFLLLSPDERMLAKQFGSAVAE